MSYAPASSGKHERFASDKVAGIEYPIANDASFKTVIYTSGGATYIGESYAGAVVSAAVWRVQKIDASGNITHAGTSASNCAKFDQVATDVATVAALSYF